MAVIFLAAAEAMRADEPKRRIIVSLPDRKIVLLEDGVVRKIYNVAVGKAATPSPSGEYVIANRIPDPTWYYGGKIVGPGKGNPLGTRWMGLSVAGYGIHGTNRPGSIGKRASHGCIRMRNADVEELFELVKVGDPVELADEVPATVAKLLGDAAAEVALVEMAVAGTPN